MPRYEPETGFASQNIPDHPVGTLDELKAHGLPSRAFRSCSEPAFDGSSKGCQFWNICAMSYKGQPVEEGGGPRHHCWERIKAPENGGGIVRNVQPCYWGVAQEEDAQANKEILQVIADEGEEYEMLTTVPDTTGPRTALGYDKWDQKLIKKVVPAFERLGEQQKMAQHELRASIIKRETENRTNARKAKQLGIQGASAPLDKRGKRSGGSPAKED